MVTNLKVNPSSFNAAKGATVTYTDTVPGNAVLSVVQCQKKKKGVCAKYKTFKTVRHTDRAGSNGAEARRRGRRALPAQDRLDVLRP